MHPSLPGHTSHLGLPAGPTDFTEAWLHNRRLSAHTRAAYRRDVTDWLTWFLGTLGRAITSAQATLDGVLSRARFWQRWAGTAINPRQVKLLNLLLDGFEDKLTSSKWARIAKCSPDTALRDITELLALGMLRKLPEGGRSTAYELVE